jgi:hypothetical protein
MGDCLRKEIVQKEVEQYIWNLSDIDLLEYTRIDTYLPEAVQFAKEELARRNLTSECLVAIEKELDDRTKTRAEETKAAASEPLAFGWRFAVFLCGLCGVLPWLPFVASWRRFSGEGARRKNRDMWVFCLLGFFPAIILTSLRIPPWSWLAELFSMSR